MREDVELLKQKFKQIKSYGLVKSLRNGPTGVGYTFETLLNKKEDQLCKPDFGCIELKCQLGYSKSSLSLFNCVPKRNGESAIKYIFEKYGYYRYGNKNDYKLFSRKIYSTNSLNMYNYEFRLKVDYNSQEILLISYCNNRFVENACSWDFKTLERHLKNKITNLAIIEAYPYRKKEGTYYKYVKLTLYKLIGFYKFLKLIEDDKIYVNFYIKSALGNNGESIIENHGVAFKINREHLNKLFYKIKQ